VVKSLLKVVFFQEKGTKVDVKPAIAEAENSFEIVQHETFAQYCIWKYSGTVENALELQNGVAQGLSSAIMTNNLRKQSISYQLQVQIAVLRM
jgi:acyl-CoA reductase-like NAD-dependent aldehyde dehydrogenase